jgi:hypothetical protein
MKKLIFEDVKEEILAALNNLPDEVGITETVGLVDGFITNPVSGELTNSLLIGGPCLPMVMLVGEKTGRIYFFALKTLLPNRVD